MTAKNTTISTDNKKSKLYLIENNEVLVEENYNIKSKNEKDKIFKANANIGHCLMMTAGWISTILIITQVIFLFFAIPSIIIPILYPAIIPIFLLITFAPTILQAIPAAIALIGAVPYFNEDKQITEENKRKESELEVQKEAINYKFKETEFKSIEAFQKEHGLTIATGQKPTSTSDFCQQSRTYREVLKHNNQDHVIKSKDFIDKLVEYVNKNYPNAHDTIKTIFMCRFVDYISKEYGKNDELKNFLGTQYGLIFVGNDENLQQDFIKKLIKYFEEKNDKFKLNDMQAIYEYAAKIDKVEKSNSETNLNQSSKNRSTLSTEKIEELFTHAIKRKLRKRGYSALPENPETISQLLYTEHLNKEIITAKFARMIIKQRAGLYDNPVVAQAV